MTAKEIAKAYAEMPYDDKHNADVMVEIDKKGLLDEVSVELWYIL